MHVLFIAWGVVALLIIGVRIGHHFGRQDALEEMQSPRRRELREVALWLDPDLARRRRQRVALAALILVLVSGVALWFR